MVMGLVAPTAAAADTDATVQPTLSFVEQEQLLEDSHVHLESAGIELGPEASTEAAAAAPGRGASFLHGVLRGIGHAGAQGSFDASMAALGSGRAKR
jgi:hypothetical protein